MGQRQLQLVGGDDGAVADPARISLDSAKISPNLLRSSPNLAKFQSDLTCVSSLGQSEVGFGIENLPPNLIVSGFKGKDSPPTVGTLNSVPIEAVNFCQVESPVETPTHKNKFH